MADARPVAGPEGERSWADRRTAARLGALAVFGLAMVVYLRTLLPGPSVGDWAEMQWIPARLAIPHPTGYPLYVLAGKAFSLIPIGSLGFRAELLSAVSAAAAAAMTVLIAARLGVRTVIAVAAGLSLALTGELWLEATFSEMNSLHLFLVALVLHRALVWRAERRDRDLLLGAFLGGLSLSNHVLAATVVPLIVVFVLIDARSRLTERPILVVQGIGLALLGLTPYLFIPIRALFGPPEIYGRFLTWDGISGLVSGADLRSQMHFSSLDTLARTWNGVPAVIAQFRDRSDLAFVVLAGIGALLMLLRDRWLALLLLLVVAVNLYFFTNYVGDLDHYLLVSWLACALWLAFGLETLLAWLEARLPPLRFEPGLAVLALVLPLAIGAGNWTTYDQSGNRDGQRFADSVFAALPEDAVLLTYWDALTTLGYEHCVEGVRPDVAMRSLDVTARVVCDPVHGTLDEVARERPLFALFAAEQELDPLRARFGFEAGPRLPVPYGKRGLDHTATLYRLVPRTP